MNFWTAPTSPGLAPLSVPAPINLPPASGGATHTADGATPALGVGGATPELKPDLSRADSTMTNSKAGRCDSATYAEAMQAASELGMVTGNDARAVTDHIDAFILEELEESTEDSGDGEDTGGNAPRKQFQRGAKQGLRSSVPAAAGPSLMRVTSEVVATMDELSSPDQWGPFIRDIIKTTLYVVSREVGVPPHAVATKSLSLGASSQVAFGLVLLAPTLSP